MTVKTRSLVAVRSVALSRRAHDLNTNWRRRVALSVASCLAAVAMGVAIPSGPVSAYTTVVYSSAGPAVPRISVIGDSVASGIRWTNSYAPLTRFNFTFDAESCRRTITPSCRGREGYAPLNVLDTMRRLRGLLGEVLVLMTGYNDAGSVFAAGVDAVMAEAAAQGIPRVIWLTMRTADVSYVSPGGISTSATFRWNNQVLFQKARQYGGVLEVADWATYSASHRSWVGADGVHLSARGAAAAATYIADVAQPVIDGESITPPATTGGLGPAAASPGPGRISVFGVGSDDAVHAIDFDGAVWSGFASLGGAVSSTPAAISVAPGVVDMFVRGTDYALWTRHFDGWSWGPWLALGGSLRSAPAVTSSWPGTLDVFVRGADHAVWTRFFDGGSWGPWTSLGGTLTSAPAVASGWPGTFDVFGVGTDQALWTISANGSQVSGWSSLGGPVSSAPAAISPSPGVMSVFARDRDQALWMQTWNGAWSGWWPLGGGLTSAPVTTSSSADTLEVFARGRDHALWTFRLFPGGWSGWIPLDGSLASAPAAVSFQPGAVAVFARGADDGLWSRTEYGNWFGGWYSLGGAIR